MNADSESELIYGLARFFTFFGIFLVLPSRKYFASFVDLNSMVSCTDYIDYSLKITSELISLFYPVLVISLVFSALGFLFTLSSLLSFGLFSVFILHALGACYSNHIFFPLGLVLLLWFIGGNPTRYSLDYLIIRQPPSTKPQYLFLFLKINFCLVFFYAGASKLYNSGASWFLTDNLKNMLIMQNFFHARFDQSLGYGFINDFIVHQPFVANVIGFLVVFLELSAISILPLRRYGKIIVLGLCLMQIGIQLTFFINFYPWIVVYIVWIFSYLDELLVRKKFWPRKLSGAKSKLSRFNIFNTFV